MAAEVLASSRIQRVVKTAGAISLILAGVVGLLLALPPAPEDMMLATSITGAQRPGKLLEQVATALHCPGPRADIVDILAGAPYEFFRREIAAGDPVAEENFQTMFQRLPQLVARVMKEKDALGTTLAETELQETVLQLAATGGGWPVALKQRLLAALAAPCKVACSSSSGEAYVGPANATRLEVDQAFTSPGTVSTRSGWLHRAMLNYGAATGIPMFVARAEQYKSRPSTVIVSSNPIAPRDCLALRGDASVALRIADKSDAAMIRQIVIEQLAHWVAPQLWSLPGRFEVWGQPVASAGGAANPYSLFMGSFEYAAAAPAPQAFELQNPVPVLGLRLSFNASTNSDPEGFMCIYRIRAFEAKAPSCTEASAKTPARLVVPLRV
jgi:hypothetical protein